ncbi:MAG: DNA recombination protein RmuC [Coriobacteriales bacterium]|jgi:DNA recombination protein RmuC|nr:DNA recombination protein RmuC [Coriobacteriales bacterium]
MPELQDILLILISGIVVIILVLLVVLLLGRRNATLSRQALENMQSQLAFVQAHMDASQKKLEGLDNDLSKMDGQIRDEFGRSREELRLQQQATREETAKTLFDTRNETTKTLQETRAETTKTLVESRLEQTSQFKEIRETMENRLGAIQNDNAIKLEEMRKTVDEKLTETVEKRFAESFSLISDRLEQVHKGLGEMQTLANGVGDLKKILSNVKARGTFGEYQLGALLEQFLSPEQYVVNAQTKKRSQERVEFAVKLPGQGEDGMSEVLLPIDSKFPLEDYERLVNAYEGIGDEAPDVVARRLQNSVKTFARSIRDKYINVPITTDFAIMFLPTEGLYAEVLRVPGLHSELQKTFRVVAVGPTNLVALLNSLQMGFRTLAIQKRSSEVWNLLGGVKTEFGKFELVLDRVKKKLDQASSEIDKAGRRSKAIGRKLKTIQELPQEESAALLGVGEIDLDYVEPVVLDDADENAED